MVICSGGDAARFAERTRWYRMAHDCSMSSHRQHMSSHGQVHHHCTQLSSQTNTGLLSGSSDIGIGSVSPENSIGKNVCKYMGECYKKRTQL